MTDTSVADKIRAILAEQAVLEPSDISLDQSLDEIGIDSLGLVETIFAIEEAFGVDVPFNANAPEDSRFDLSSVASVVAAVEGLIAEKAS